MLLHFILFPEDSSLLQHGPWRGFQKGNFKPSLFNWEVIIRVRWSLSLESPLSGALGPAMLTTVPETKVIFLCSVLSFSTFFSIQQDFSSLILRQLWPEWRWRSNHWPWSHGVILFWPQSHCNNAAIPDRSEISPMSNFFKLFLQFFTTSNWTFQIWIKIEQNISHYFSKFLKSLIVLWGCIVQWVFFPPCLNMYVCF